MYNLHAQSEDGKVTEQVLLNPGHPQHPDVVVMVADANALQGQLFLVLQIRELGIPCMLLLNRMHTTGPSRSELRAEARRLEEALDLPVRVVNAMKDKAEAWVRGWEPLLSSPKACAAIRPCPRRWKAGVRNLKPHLSEGTPGLLCHVLRMQDVPAWLSEEAQTPGSKHALTCPVQRRCSWKKPASAWPKSRQFCPPHRAVDAHLASRLDQRADPPGVGRLGVWARLFPDVPSGLQLGHRAHRPLDGWMAAGMDAVKGALPDTWWRSLIVDGVLAGLAGILIFLPQIMILSFTAVLEHSGAMARLVTWATVF